MHKVNHFRKATMMILAVIFLSLVVINSVEEPIIQESEDVKNLREEITKTVVVEEPKEAVFEEPEIIEEPEEEPEKPVVKTFISDAKCEDGIISLRLNNLYDDRLNVGWSTFFISGKINPNPGCDMDYLEPGESTYCDNVGAFPRKGRRRVAIAMYKHTTVGVTVDCGNDNFVTGGVIQEVPYYGFNAVFFVFMLILLLFTFNYYRVHY